MKEIAKKMAAVGIGYVLACSPFAINHLVITTIISGYFMGVR